MVSLGDLQTTSEQAICAPHNQFITDGIKLDLPSKVSKLEFTQVSGFDSRYEQVFDSLLGKDIWRGEKTEKKTDTSEYGGITTIGFRNEAKKLYGCVGDNGFITFIKPESFDAPYSAGLDIVKTYDISSGGWSGDKYLLSDGEYSISEAADFTRKWLAEKYAALEPDYTFKVRTVDVKKSGGFYCFAITVQKLYNGTPLDSLVLTSQKEDRTKLQYTVSRLELTIHKRADISSLTNGSGMIIPQVRHDVTRLLSLQSALLKCQDKFSAFNEINVSSIALKYTIEPVYSANDPYKTYNYAGRKYTSHVMWEFVISDAGEQKKEKQYKSVKYIYADALTGEIGFDFDGVTIG